MFKNVTARVNTTFVLLNPTFYEINFVQSLGIPLELY